MKIADILLESIDYPAPRFSQDNPGGRWLQDKVARSEREGRNSFGVPSVMGSVTGHFESPVLVSLDILVKVKGMRDEQSNVRGESLKGLIDYMGTHNRLPPMSHSDDEYAPFINVDYTGTPWVNEGNHRIMAAHALGWEYLPVTVSYFNGGEDIPGIFEPKKLIAEHSKWSGQSRIG